MFEMTKQARSAVDLVARPAFHLIATLVDFDRSRPTKMNAAITLGDVDDDVALAYDEAALHESTPAHKPERPDAADNRSVGPASTSDKSETSDDVRWSDLWSYMNTLEMHGFYALAVAAVSLLLTAMCVILLWRGESLPTPIWSGAGAGWLSLPSVHAIHRPTGSFTPIQRSGLRLAAGVMTFGGTVELFNQLSDLSRINEPSVWQRLTLAIPIGMLELTVVLVVAIVRGTDGTHRHFAAPGWLLVGLGCVATYFQTDAVKNLGLAACCVAAALMALTHAPRSRHRSPK